MTPNGTLHQRLTRRGDIMFAQVVDIDGLSLLDGSGQLVIEPGDKPAILEDGNPHGRDPGRY